MINPLLYQRAYSGQGYGAWGMEVWREADVCYALAGVHQRCVPEVYPCISGEVWDTGTPLGQMEHRRQSLAAPCELNPR